MAGSPTAPRQAAFFDVDGTLADTTIAHYYRYFMLQRLSPLRGKLWHAGFWVKCGYYLWLDRRDRLRLNVVFYRNYGGLPTAEIKAHAGECYRQVLVPRFYPQAAACIEEHRRAGRVIVLVTGSLDFLVEPLAREIGATSVLAASLVESNGRFTGELNGPPIGTAEKASRIRRLAEREGIDLSRSFAYGDSAADLPMLEAVGHPQVVNPDRALAAAAKARAWPVHRWTVPAAGAGNGQ